MRQGLPLSRVDEQRVSSLGAHPWNLLYAAVLILPQCGNIGGETSCHIFNVRCDGSFLQLSFIPPRNYFLEYCRKGFVIHAILTREFCNSTSIEVTRH